MGRFGSKQPSDSNFFNAEVALNELLNQYVSDTAVVTQVADSDSVQTLLAANTDRTGYSIYNDSTAILYIKHGTGATTGDFTYRLVPNGYYESGQLRYRGIITGIWASDQSGQAQVTEYS